MPNPKLYCVSHNRHITVFEAVLTRLPGTGIVKEVVVAVNDAMLFNHLLPENCPRISFRAIAGTTEEDKKKFLGASTARHILCIDAKWLLPVQRSILYCYELSSEHFLLYDQLGGYYISNRAVSPLAIKPVYNILEELLKRDIELRFLSPLDGLATQLKHSSLHYNAFGLQAEDQSAFDLRKQR